MPDEQPSFQKDLGLSLIDTLASSDLSSMLEDQAEVLVDRMLKEGVLKDIPIIGTLTGMIKTVFSVRDYLLVLKLVRFLQGIKINEQERATFNKAIEGDENYKRTIGENLIMLLDRLDDVTKADMLARLFQSVLRDEITYPEFMRFASVIDRAFIEDIHGLLKTCEGIHRREEYAQRFYHLGLATLSFEFPDSLELGTEAKNDPSRGPVKFTLSREAFVFAQILIGKVIHDYDFVTEYQQHRPFRHVEV